MYSVLRNPCSPCSLVEVLCALESMFSVCSQIDALFAPELMLSVLYSHLTPKFDFFSNYLRTSLEIQD